MNNLKEVLYQINKSIESNKSEQPTVTLTLTFHKPVGEENPYIRFGYGPHKNFNHTRGQVSGSMNSDLINANKQVKNQR